MRNLFHFVLYRVPLVMPTLMFFVKKMQYALLSFYKDPADLQLIKAVSRERKMLLQPVEAHTIVSLARMQSRLEGDMAEVGVFQGASAKLICSVNGDRSFWGFDTFAGLQDVTDADTHWGVSFFKPGQYQSSQEEVEAFLAPFTNTHLIAGYFPESAGEIEDRSFSFVHLDVDTRDSTFSSLRYFWPKMVPGGIILTHDAHAKGVAEAAELFVQETGARSFATTGSQLAFLK